VQPFNSKLPRAVAAFRIAVISAWAVGSLLAVTLFTPVAITTPSLTMTAPNGPPAPESTLPVARLMAMRKYCSSACSKCFISIFLNRMQTLDSASIHHSDIRTTYCAKVDYGTAGLPNDSHCRITATDSLLAKLL